MTNSSSDKYTDPELRDRIKEEIQASDKGGEPGQWSARKAQMMAKQYKEEGGGYKDDKKDEKAQHLDKWTEEEWQTKDGDANARSEEGTHRYLPKKAWDKLDDDEKEATDEQKLEGSKAGDQYVENTDKAKKARKEVSQEPEQEEQDQSPSKKRKTGEAEEEEEEEEEGEPEEEQEEEENDDIAVPQGGEDDEEEEPEDAAALDNADDEDFAEEDDEEEEQEMADDDEEYDPDNE